MTTHKHAVITNYAKKQMMAVLAIIFLLPALWITGTWIEVWNSHSELTSAARDSHFLEHFPSFMSTTAYVAVINFVCGIISLTLAARSFKQRSLFLRILTMITAMVAFLVLVLTFFMIL